MLKIHRHETRRHPTKDLVVNAYRIIATDFVVIQACEPCNGHSTLQTFDGKSYGRIGSRKLPHDIDLLPGMSEERYVAVKAWHDREYQEAYDTIEALFPEVKGMVQVRGMGEIEVVVPRANLAPCK